MASIPAGSLGRTGLRQVPVTVEELVENAVVEARDILPTGMTAGAVTEEADGLPAAPRFFSRSNFLLIAHIPAETCPCLALHAPPMHSPPPPPPPAAWQGHILPFLAGTLLFFHVALTGSLPPTDAPSDAAFRAAATSLAQPVQTSAPAPLPGLLQGSLQQLKTPNPAGRCSSRAAVCTSGLAGRQQSVIQLERS